MHLEKKAYLIKCYFDTRAVDVYSKYALRFPSTPTETRAIPARAETRGSYDGHISLGDTL